MTGPVTDDGCSMDDDALAATVTSRDGERS